MANSNTAHSRALRAASAKAHAAKIKADGCAVSVGLLGDDAEAFKLLVEKTGGKKHALVFLLDFYKKSQS